ncbi:MAG: cytochrome b/b6 domain-containing protein [Acidobacteriota bacterium]
MADKVAAERGKIRTFQRFSLEQRIQHILLVVLMIILAVTGLALMYHKTWLGALMIKIEGGVEARGYIHRTAAIAMIILCLYHVWYVIFREEGHREMMHFKIRGKDFKDFFDQLRANLGLSVMAPLYDRYSYKEKFQYWGVLVGIILMTNTGFILWFEDQALTILPKWVMDLTTIIHGYQGLILFIILFLWHVYNVHLSLPFRFNRIWLTGEISEEELKRTHPLEYERIKDSDKEQP